MRFLIYATLRDQSNVHCVGHNCPMVGEGLGTLGKRFDVCPRRRDKGAGFAVAGAGLGDGGGLPLGSGGGLP